MRAVQRHTIFDIMEAKGVFRSNPANAGSVAADGTQLYKGPVPFPRMVYAAEEEIIVPGVWEDTKQGVKLLNEQRAIKSKVVENQGEFEAALVAGWYDHPAKALGAIIQANRAAGIEDRRSVPTVSAQETLDSYKKEIEELKAKLEKAEELAKISSLPSPEPKPRGLSAR